MAIASSGVCTSFFDNPYVRNMLLALNERHRPIYRKKLARVLICVNDVLKDEVSTVYMHDVSCHCESSNSMVLLCMNLFHVQIKLIVTELYLNYMRSFFASTSDFWAQPILKRSFGGCIASMMANGYYFHNRVFLAVSDTTMRIMNVTNDSHKVFLHKDPIIHCFQALLSFIHWDSVKSGQLIGD